MYRVFKRTWWRENRAWPRGLEPHPGEKHYIEDHEYEDAGGARDACCEFNIEPRSYEEERLGLKYEFESD
jgi:hypothetical protein